MPVRPPPITIAGSRTCRLASESRLAAPVELQRHQEVGRLAHAADQVVLDVDDRRLARARRDRDVVEPHRERLVGVDGAAEADAAVDAEARPPRQRQVQRAQEALVPAHGDAVLGDAAEAGQPPLVERRRQLVPALDRARRPRVRADQIRRQRLDLEAVDADDAEAGVEQVVRQREAGRARARRPARSCRCTGARPGASRLSGFQRVSRP